MPASSSMSTRGNCAERSTLYAATNLPAVRTRKEKAEFQPYSREKDQKIKDQGTNENEPAPSDLSCPVEVIQNILKYADSPTLNQCLRVSKEFYQVAAPLLYSNVILKDQHPLTKILVGSELVDRPANRHSKAVVNLKSTALSAVQQITVFKHSCKRSSFASDTFPNLKTLLIVPHLDSVEERWCAARDLCPILRRARPEKVVIYDGRYQWTKSTAQWPMYFHYYLVTSPKLTWIVDETDFGCKPDWDGFKIRCEDLKEARLIIRKKPPGFDRIARRDTVSSKPVIELFYMMIAPFLLLRHCTSVTKTIYLFRVKAKELDHIKQAIDRWLDDVYPYVARMHSGSFLESLKSAYTIKTLDDYIKEGVDDELLEEELQYWREENTRRLNKVKIGVVGNEANQV